MEFFDEDMIDSVLDGEWIVTSTGVPVKAMTGVSTVDTAIRRQRLSGSGSASEDFQRLVDACLKDGLIDKSEAVALVQQHNNLQAKSREALVKLLEKHGHTWGPQSLHRHSVSIPKRAVPPRPEPSVTYASLHTSDPAFGSHGIAGIRLGKKTTFLLIVGPAVIVSLLALLGVI